MPRFPALSPHAQQIRHGTFVAFQAKLRAQAAAGNLIPLHLGDTYPLPPEASRRIDLDQPGLHRYGPVTGDPALRDAAAADLQGLGLTSADPERTFITPGSTGALDMALNAVTQPGDEVLVLTPSWPLIFGLCHRRGVDPVQVDVDPSGWLPEPELLGQRVAAAVSERTVGLYFCHPNNPCGFVYSPAHLRALAAVAREHGLWVVVDAVYADMVFAEAEPLSPLAAVQAELVDSLAERVLVASSYSKSFGLAGHRVGTLVAPPTAADAELGPAELIPRLITHSVYHAGRAAQAMALAALRGDAGGERALRRDVARAGAALVEERLGGVVPFRPALAGAFVFLDLRGRAADADALLALLDRCLDRGVSLAPGGSFGEGFGRFARLCFTATPPEELAEGLDRLRGVLA
jgi:aspartate aminotransferase